MADTTGYVPLDFVGFTDKGSYAESSTYMTNDLVHYQNSVWKCTLDNTQGIVPGENNNWTVFISSTAVLNGIIADDEQGILGEAGAGDVNAQLLFNAVADRVANQLLKKADLISQIVNDATKVASMAALYAVNQKIGDVANLPDGAADVVSAIVAQNSNLKSFLQVKKVRSNTFTTEANNSKTVEVEITPPNGYSFLCVTNVSGSHQQVIPWYCNVSNNIVTVLALNPSSIVREAYIELYCLFIKTLL